MLNYAELNDLNYHIKLMKFMKTQPSETESSTQNSTVKPEKEVEEECKEVEEQILDESEMH